MKIRTFILAFLTAGVSTFAAEPLQNASESFRFFEDSYFVPVEGGTFKSFSSDRDPDSYALHDETVKDFYIARYEVTIELYNKVMKKEAVSPSLRNRPVEDISGYECVEFCNALSRIDGFEECYSVQNGKWICDFSKNGYRLPTLPEWEYAARGGKKSRNFKYAGSNDIREAGWYNENSNGHANPVGLLKPNELGIYDMSGNAGERCWDISYKGENPAHVGRGGCWIFYEGYCEPDYRFVTTESYSSEGLGLRLVRSRL